MTQDQGKTWAEIEFGETKLGDQRLTKRLTLILEIFANHPTLSIPQACGPWSITKATYRFLDNDKVKDQEILIPHQLATQKRIQNHPIVLAIQDTTELDFSHHPSTQGLGVLSDPNHHGLLYHPTLLVTPNKIPLGLLDHQVWQRPPEDFGKRHTRKHRPICEKESQKWLNSLEKTAQLQKTFPNLHFVNIADREADIFDFFLLAQRLKVDLLVRAAWNRRVNHPEKYLWNHMKKVPVSGFVTITVPRKKGQTHREAPLYPLRPSLFKTSPTSLQRKRPPTHNPMGDLGPRTKSAKRCGTHLLDAPHNHSRDLLQGGPGKSPMV